MAVFNYFANVKQSSFNLGEKLQGSFSFVYKCFSLRYKFEEMVLHIQCFQMQSMLRSDSAEQHLLTLKTSSSFKSITAITKHHRFFSFSSMNHVRMLMNQFTQTSYHSFTEQVEDFHQQNSSFPKRHQWFRHLPTNTAQGSEVSRTIWSFQAPAD